MIFGDGFEPPTPPPPRPVLVAQSAWRGSPTWEHMATVQDYLRPPVQGRYCIQFATHNPAADPSWPEVMAHSECVFGFDEFDSPHAKRELPWLNHVYKAVPDGATLVCNAACGAFPKRTTPRTAADIPVYPERCDVLACTPQYDSAFLPPLEELKARGKPIMIWLDAYIAVEWGTCPRGSWNCLKAYERVKIVKARQILERYWDDPMVWGFDIFIGRKPNNTPSNSRDLPQLRNLRAYLEAYFLEKNGVTTE